MKQKFGSHVKYKKMTGIDNSYLVGAAKTALSYDASAMMIYLGPPQSSKRINPQLMQLEEYEQKYEHLLPKENILVHGPYIINPASPLKYKFAIEFLKQEIAIMNYLGLKYIVIHPGAATTFSKTEALTTLVKTLKAVIEATENVIICLETMSGKGTEIGVKLDDLRWVYDQVNSSRVAICLDTCHLWDAGYDLNDFDRFIDLLKQKQIYDLVQAIHVNDSKNELGAHKDRHANIGEGKIPFTTLKSFVAGEHFSNAIKILETPYKDGKPIYKQEIALLK